MAVQHPGITDTHRLCACLPFVELARESVIQIGPVIFWPASKSEEFLLPEDHAQFQKYLESIGQIKARSSEDTLQFINTVKLTPQCTTCISMDKSVSVEAQEFILIDSLYLLYFACTYRSLYYGQEILSFNAFRKMIPASLEFIRMSGNWEHLHIDEAFREQTVCIHMVDKEICQGLGKALDAIYIASPMVNEEKKQFSKRLVRSIRYFVDRFFQRFVNLFEKGLIFPNELFEAEDVIFLTSSFETLFDIDIKDPAADFKHKLRPLLHLKYGSPVELFWKWVDDFYNVKKEVIHGNIIFNPNYCLNPCFEVPHIYLGVKLFIYSVYYMLYKQNFIASTHEDSYSPPDFKWIHPQEILIFFWT